MHMLVKVQKHQLLTYVHWFEQVENQQMEFAWKGLNQEYKIWNKIHKDEVNNDEEGVKQGHGRVLNL